VPDTCDSFFAAPSESKAIDLGKVGLAPFVGGSFDSLAFSPALVVYSDEVIRQARKIYSSNNDLTLTALPMNL